jgi:hypothetical protein
MSSTAGSLSSLASIAGHLAPVITPSGPAISLTASASRGRRPPSSCSSARQRQASTASFTRRANPRPHQAFRPTPVPRSGSFWSLITGSTMGPLRAIKRVSAEFPRHSTQGERQVQAMSPVRLRGMLGAAAERRTCLSPGPARQERGRDERKRPVVRALIDYLSVKIGLDRRAAM